MSFPAHLEYFKNETVVHHYWHPATGSHWLFCKQFNDDIWEGFGYMPHFCKEGEWGSFYKSEFDNSMPAVFCVPKSQKRMHGNLKNVVIATMMFG